MPLRIEAGRDDATGSVEPPRRPHGRCLAGALQRKQSLQFPGTVAAAPQRCSLCSPSSRCSPQMGSAPASSRCISQVPLTVAAPPQAVTVAAASRARIAVRIEAGRDGDDAATTRR